MSATAPRRTAELFAAVFTAAAAILAYLLARPGVARWAGAPVGHLLGAVGLGLMLWAGFGYTWRKRSTAPGVTAMRAAMYSHVAAGLLGPLLVILHSGFTFHGLAGILSLAMVLVVASGVVGRALFGAVPREVTVADPIRLAMLDAELARLEVQRADAARSSAPDPATEARVRRAMTDLQHEQEVLRTSWRAAGGAVAWRKVLSGWWFLHVPVSMALWLLALAHVGGALWYGTFSR